MRVPSALLALSFMAIALVYASPSWAGPPTLVDPETSAEQRAGAGQRPRDLAANPAYLALATADCLGLSMQDAACGADPFREPARWSASRGTHYDVAFTNRYGATLRGDLYAPALPFVDPVTGASSEGPFPVVMFLPGYGSAREPYRWAPQGFAEAGYVALSFDPQGYGESDRDPQPREEFCDPEGWWTQPQEMDFVENGECAGQSDGSITDVTVGQVQALAVDDWEAAQRVYNEASPQLIFGAFDAADWLASPANPARDLVDETRFAIAGHSLGAYGAMMVANGGADARFLAAVGWDGYGVMDYGVAPTVPTMFQQSQQENALGPRVVAPDPEGLHPTRATHAAFGAACVPSTFVVLGASTHGEWAFSPFAEASRLGERVAFYHALAWFGAFVKGAATQHERGDETAQREDAQARLAAPTFDESADRTSSGAGLYDPASGENVPHAIAGLAIDDQLSPYFRSERDPTPGCAP